MGVIQCHFGYECGTSLNQLTETSCWFQSSPKFLYALPSENVSIQIICSICTLWNKNNMHCTEREKNTIITKIRILTKAKKHYRIAQLLICNCVSLNALCWCNLNFKCCSFFNMYLKCLNISSSTLNLKFENYFILN